mgnify:CR=1 FL=1
MSRIWLCSLILTVGVPAWAESYPYAVTILNDSVVRCGAGDAYYATEQVTAGDTLEVYRKEFGGWLAVRPPADSFSWVREQSLKMTSEAGIAEVTQDRAMAWIGSTLEQPVRSHSQVRLKLGEFVEVVGEERRVAPSTGATELWYRIAPPAGEFRWIHERDVRRQESPETAGVESVLVRATGFHNANLDKRASPDSSPWTRRETAEPDAANEPGILTGFHDAPGERHQASGSSAPTNLNALDIELSRMVASPIEQWNLSPLMAMLDETTPRTPAEERLRGQLQQRLQQCDELYQRHESLYVPEDLAAAETPMPLTDFDEPVGSGLRGMPRASASNDFAATIDPRYDVTGWLMPVRSSKRIVPPYAIADSEGNVITYISPAPGLNLHRYLKKEIGIYGQRGYVPALKKPHVTAERIVDLARHRR